MENKRSQVELLYRDIKVMLDEVDRLRAENKFLKHNYDRVKEENAKLNMKLSSWILLINSAYDRI